MKRGRKPQPGAPPTKLPNGKDNPAYGKWLYHNSPKQKECVLKNNKRYQEKKHGSATDPNTVKCISCHSIYTKDDALIRGYPKMPGWRKVLCDLCQ